MISLDEQNIINSKTKQFVYSLEFLDKNENTISEAIIDVVSGSVNFDVKDGARSSLSLTLKNLDKRYIPSPNSKLWINNKFRFKAGYRYGNNQTLFYNQGVFVLGNPSLLSTPTQKEISIQGLDKWNLLNGTISGALKNQVNINIGDRIDAVVRTILNTHTSEKKYIIDDCPVLVPYTVIAERGNTVASLIEELCNICNYSCFYDMQGYLRFTKNINIEDIETMPVDWEYTTKGLYLQSTRELKWNEIRNSIILYGAYDESSGIQYSATAKDETGSELSIDKIGERVKVFEFDVLYSNDLCQQRANYELLQNIKAQEIVTVQTIPNFSHQLSSVVVLDDRNNGSSGRYLIQSISYNIEHNPTMNLGLWKVRNIR